MEAPQDENADQPLQLPLNVDDLRRSGKTTIWPYVMRELPISPLRALHLELQSKGWQGKLADTCSTATAVERVKGVEYFPARLTPEDLDSERVYENECTREPLAGFDLDMPRTTFEGGSRCEESLSDEVRGKVTVPPDRSLTIISGTMKEDQRPKTSRPRRRPPADLLARATSSELHRRSDFTECRVGCGKEIRVQDLDDHENSLCHLRYINCLMPGCSTLVQAKSLGIHLRRDCPLRRKQRLLADRGRALELNVACDACCAVLPRKHLRVHLANECPTRAVQCSNPGCTEVVQAGELANHEKTQCKAAKRKAMLIENFLNTAREERCSLCGKTMIANLFRMHSAEECPMRAIHCPNRSLGCGEELKAGEVAFHLQKNCIVQIDRAERASRHEGRCHRTQCSGCGYMVDMQRLRHHHRHKCPNRMVPCKHWELGCQAMLRLSTMDEHLKVDRLLDPRSCLAFDSGKAYIALNEEDRKPPWTVEIWIWRPNLVEGTREKARVALKALWDFQKARDDLVQNEKRLAVLEPILAKVATQAAANKSTEAEKAREQVMDEMIAAATVRDDAKVKLVVAVVVLSNSLDSVKRGVEEITAQNRLRGLDRLALGSAPWYAVAPGRSPPYRLAAARDVVVRETEQTVIRTPASPKASPTPRTKNSAVQHLREEAREGIPPLTINVATLELQKGAGSASSPRAKNKNVIGPKSTESAIDGGLQPIGLSAGTDRTASEGAESTGKAQDKLAKDEADNGQRREAEFWADWVASTGPALARRILQLAGETLPRLKEETAIITGRTTGEVFRTAGNPDAEQARTLNTGGSSADDTSTASGRGSPKRRKAAKKAKRKQKHEKQFGKSLEARIVEEVGKSGGVDTIFGSAKALFQLEIGAKDRVGIKVVGNKDHIFNYRCPRERWVHLAFVADSVGVVLYENGKTVSRLDDVTVALPMREIGGRDAACQCLMHEVRYWTIKRSKEDLVAWMHEVLPHTCVSDGILGYWTFEEGAGEYVNDVTEQRFRARKVGRGLKWVAPENMCGGETGASPTPSWRERNVCKVELRRGKLAQRGRLHDQYMACPAGCGENFMRRNARAHARYRCIMRVVGCSIAGCEKRMPAKDIPRHLEEYCAPYSAFLRKADAGFEFREPCSCPHCAEIVKRCNLKLHVKYICQWVKEPCRNLDCAAWIPRVRRDEHEKRFCGSRSAVRKRKRLAKARSRSKYRRDWVQDDLI